MKKYYVHYYLGDNENAYRLYWADSPAMEAALPEGAERITRKDALVLAWNEAFSRKYECGHKRLADATIRPAGTEHADLRNYYSGYVLKGRIWERRYVGEVWDGQRKIDYGWGTAAIR